MQGPKRCLGSMSRSNDTPRLPLTWTRFGYQSVPVPSTAGAARPTGSCRHRTVRQRVVRLVVGLGVAHLQRAGTGRYGRG